MEYKNLIKDFVGSNNILDVCEIYSPSCDKYVYSIEFCYGSNRFKINCHFDSTSSPCDSLTYDSRINLEIYQNGKFEYLKGGKTTIPPSDYDQYGIKGYRSDSIFRTAFIRAFIIKCIEYIKKAYRIPIEELEYDQNEVIKFINDNNIVIKRIYECGDGSMGIILSKVGDLPKLVGRYKNIKVYNNKSTNKNPLIIL